MQLAEKIRVNPQKYVLRFLALLVGLLLLWLLVRYLTTGSVTINTDRKNTVILRKAGSNTEAARSTGRLKASMAPGTYIVTVGNALGNAKQVITIKARHHLTYTVNPPSPLTLEPVLPFGTTSVTASNDQMHYIDTRNSLLYEIGKNGTSTVVDSNIALDSVSWQNAANGVALARDKKSLYSVTNGGLSPLQLPFTNTQILSFSLSPTGVLFVSDGTNIYKQENGVFSKVPSPKLTSKQKISKLVASSSALLVRISKEGSSTIENDEADTVIMDYKGNQTARVDDLGAFDLAWSPDGKYIAVTNEKETLIYNRSLQEVAKAPDRNVTSLGWLDKDTILYGFGRGVFTYHFSTGQANRLTTTDSGTSVSKVSPSQDGSYVYVENQRYNNSGLRYTLFRANLQNTRVADYLAVLNIFLPTMYGECRIGYVNFSKPTITMSSSGTEQGCRADAVAVMNQDNLPPSSFAFQYTGGE